MSDVMIGEPMSATKRLVAAPALGTVTLRIKAEARRLGFDLCGVCPAVAPPESIGCRSGWRLGTRAKCTTCRIGLRRRAHPQHVLDGAHSIVMLAMNYRTAGAASAAAGAGESFALCLGTRLSRSDPRAAWQRWPIGCAAEVPAAKVRGVVDTAPLLEREFAQLAGLGWIGKNTLLLNKQVGSWFFLAALLTDLELDYDAPHETDHCGTCRACLDACPTGAFVDAYVLDARRCISYLTIELRELHSAGAARRHGRLAVRLRRVPGCLPVESSRAAWRMSRSLNRPTGMNPIDLAELFDLDDAAFRDAVSAHAAVAAQAARTAAQRGDRAGQPAACGSAAGVGARA